MMGLELKPDVVVDRVVDIRIRKFQGNLRVSGSGEVLELSDTAAFIFRQIDGVRTLEEISTVVASHYDAELEEIQEDVRDLLTELLVNKVVVVVSPPRPDAPELVHGRQ